MTLSILLAWLGAADAARAASPPANPTEPGPTSSTAVAQLTPAAADPWSPQPVVDSGAVSSAADLFATPAGAAKSGSSIDKLAAARRWLVWFQPTASAAQRAEFRHLAGIQRNTVSKMFDTLEYWQFGAGNRNPAAVRRILSSPAVRSVDIDVVRQTLATPNDPSYSQLWGLVASKANLAWARTTGSKSVTVAILDTGLRMDHEDLSANLWTNPGEIPANGLDDDRNGFVDDLHGWDFVNGDNNPTDDNFHGTHVAGTVGAVGNNGVGVTGVAWNVSLMPLKICDGNGRCYLSAEIDALAYALRLGVRISNNSYGAPYSPIAAESAAIAAAGAGTAGNPGMLFVAAAGNNTADNDQQPFFPASYNLPNVISVAAAEVTGARAYFSNYGDESVDLAAPGFNILSTYNAASDSYAALDGTSMAAPHVAGAAALLASQWEASNVSWSPADMRTRLLGTTSPAANWSGLTRTGGVLDIDAATDLAGVAIKPFVFVHLHGSGSGSVTSDVGGCTTSNCTLRPNLASGSTVTFSAMAAPGSVFAGWQGDCSGSSPTCTVNLSGLGQTAIAVFKGVLENGGAVSNQLSGGSALPSSDINAYPIVSTIVSADGMTRFVGRYFTHQSENGCSYLTSDTGGVTVERLVSGAWITDGPRLDPPTALDPGFPGSRWFNCNGFGRQMASSADGSRLVVNLGARYFGTSPYQMLCGLAVYERTASGWSNPTVLRPASFSECFSPGPASSQLLNNWLSASISDDGNTIIESGFGSAHIFKRGSGGWALSATVAIPTPGPIYSAWDSASFAMSPDGRSFAVGFPAANPISCGNSGCYYAGRISIFGEISGSWQPTAELVPADGMTIGTQALGRTLAFSGDGQTLVASFGRTWASIRDYTNWVGGAWVFERTAGGWSHAATISNPAPTMSSYDPAQSYECPLISRTAARIVCGATGRVGMNVNQGWYEVHDRGGATWSNPFGSHRLFNPDGSSNDVGRISAGTAALENVYLNLNWNPLSLGQYDLRTVGELLQPGAAAATALQPVLGIGSQTATGYSVQVLNYDPLWTFTAAVVSHDSSNQPTVSMNSGGLVSVDNLAADKYATVRITASRGGFQTGASLASGKAQLATANNPIFGEVYQTPTGFFSPISNFDPGFNYGSGLDAVGGAAAPTWSTADGMAVVDNLATGSTARLLVWTSRTGFNPGLSALTASAAAGGGLQPNFATPVSTAVGAVVQINNFDRNYSFTPALCWTNSTSPVTVSLNSNGLVTVAGMSNDSRAAVCVRSSRPGEPSLGNWIGVQHFATTSAAPLLGAVTSTADGMRVQISNFSAAVSYASAITQTNSSTQVEATIDAAGLVTVSRASAGSTSTVTVFAVVPGANSGAAAASAPVLQSGWSSSFSNPTPTTNGFTVNLTNYNALYTYSITTSSGTVTKGKLSGTTLPLTVSGLSTGALATVTVTTSRTGYSPVSSTVTGSAALGAALTPTFSVRTPTATGYTFNITNYNSSYSFTASITSGSGSVALGTPSGSTLPVIVTGVTAGTTSVKVATSRVGYNSGSATASASAMPVITSVAPSGGVVKLGTAIVINGTNLWAATAVTFGGATASKFTVVDANTIVVGVFKGAKNGAIKVTTAGGTAGSSATYTISTQLSSPAASSGLTVAPSSGGAGTAVLLTGANIGAATAVTRGSLALPFRAVSSDQLVVAVPVGMTTGTLTVTTAGGSVSTSLSFSVTSSQSPVIVSVSGPASPGRLITLTGSNLGAVNSITFNGVGIGGFSVLSTTSVGFLVPATATLGSTATIAVTTSGGSDSTSLTIS